jgi:hypothetical protein
MALLLAAYGAAALWLAAIAVGMLVAQIVEGR